MTDAYGQGSGDDAWPPGGGDPPLAWSGDPSTSPLHALLGQLSDRPLGRLTRRLRRLRRRSEQLARRDPSSVPNVFAPEVGAVASSAPGRRRRRRRLSLSGDRFLISLVLAGGMLLPFYSAQTRLGESAPLEFAADSPQQTLYEVIDALQPGDLVLVGMEYGPTAAGELDTVANVLMRHILLRRALPVVVSRYPVTLLRAEHMLLELGVAAAPLLQQLEREDPLLANGDWFVTRFLAGDMAGLRSLTMNIEKQLAKDLRGAPTGLRVDELEDFARVLVVAERPGDLRQWAEQIAPLADSNLLGAVGQAAAPLTRPWLDVALAGMMSGFRDALTYDSQLQGLEVIVGPPSAPRSVMALSRDESIALTWDPPLSDGGASITGYTTRRQSTPYLTWVEVAATGTSHTLTSLDNGTSYDIQVRASNSEGDSGWSDLITATPRTVPSQPRSLDLTAGDTSVAASWQEPAADGGSVVTGYRLRWRTGSEDWQGANTTETEFTAAGLTNGDIYEFQVRASNFAGDGDWSASEMATSLAGAQALAAGAADSQQSADTPAATATAGIILGIIQDGAAVLSLYSAPDSGSALAGQVSPGDAVLVLLRNGAGDWLFVQTNGGLRGWLTGASVDLGPASVADVPPQVRPEPAAPVPTPLPPPTPTVAGPQPEAAQASEEAADEMRSSTILQAEEREASIHVGLALSIVLIALGGFGNTGRAVLSRRRRRRDV